MLSDISRTSSSLSTDVAEADPVRRTAPDLFTGYASPIFI
jgi:hypothetical protein